jgi:hypothetical protein
MKTDDVMQALKDELTSTLTDLGKNATEAQTQLDSFLTDIQPDIDTALAENDLMSLELIRDRVAIKVGQISLNLIASEQLAIVSAVTTTLRTLIKIGLGLIVV